MTGKLQLLLAFSCFCFGHFCHGLQTICCSRVRSRYACGSALDVRSVTVCLQVRGSCLSTVCLILFSPQGEKRL